MDWSKRIFISIENCVHYNKSVMIIFNSNSNRSNTYEFKLCLTSVINWRLKNETLFEKY